jgi:hypothetical protein
LAQLVIQNAELIKFKQALEAKEKKKKSERTVLFPGGLGRYLTDLELTRELKDQDARKEAKTAEKAQRKVSQEAWKVAKAAADGDWKRVVAEHEKVVELWKANCTLLRLAGTNVKDLPTKPKWLLKPRVAKDMLGSGVGAGGDNEEETSSNEDDDVE